MWPMEIDIMMSKLDGIRDIIRIAYGAEGKNRSRLFLTAKDMMTELAEKMNEQTPDDDD